MSSRNIIICGDLPSPIGLCVPDPNKWTVSNLKQEVIKHVPKATANDITLYVGEDKVPEGKPLSECDGVRNGTALLVSIKGFIINVYCPDKDVTVNVEIPLVEFDSWTVSTVCEAVCFKLGIHSYWSSNNILMFNGISLSNPASRISSISDVSSNCLMTYTRLEKRQLLTPQHNVTRYVLLPVEVCEDFAKSHCFYNRDLNNSWRVGNWLSAWQIVVQQLDGSLTTVLLPDPHKMSVICLREAVEKVLSVPTHQQKLLLGDSHTVLEDWSPPGRRRYEEMLINAYPSFCDGIKLYLIQLTEGIRVNVSKSRDQINVSSGYINIHNPSVCTLKNLALIMQKISNMFIGNLRDIYISETVGRIVSPSDKPVSSVQWITNGCTLTLHKPDTLFNPEDF